VVVSLLVFPARAHGLDAAGRVLEQLARERPRRWSAAPGNMA
jgi:hypothetical protein